MRVTMMLFAYLPALVLALGVMMKLGFQKFIRFQPIGPKVEHLEEADLVAALSSSSILCVGCTRGVGEAIAKDACSRGARVTVVGRTDPVGLRKLCTTVDFVRADLSLMGVATRVIRELPLRSVDTVVFTVGIVNGPARQESAEGIELEAAVSFLSRFVMTNALLRAQEAFEGKLVSTSTRKPRIFVMGFPGVPDTPQLEDFNWERSWQAWPSHKNTVVANDALVLGVAAKYPHLINIYGLNPGVIKTDLMFDFLGGKDSWISRTQQFVIGLICPSADDYAPVAVQLLVSPQLESQNGASFNQYGEPIQSCGWLLAGKDRRQLVWDEAEKLQHRALSAVGSAEPRA